MSHINTSFVKTLGLIAFVFTSFIGSVASSQNEQSSKPAFDVTKKQFDKFLESSPSNVMFKAIQSFFPEDSERLKADMLEILNSARTETEVTARAIVLGEQVRRKHVHHLKTAPDSSLWTVLQSQIQVIEALKHDPMLCNRFAMYGSSVLPDDQKKLLMPLVEDATYVLFQSMYEGKTFPVDRADPTGEDWFRLVEELYANGGTEEDINRAITPNISDPKLCPSILHLVRVVADADFEGSDRLRAVLAYEIIGG